MQFSHTHQNRSLRGVSLRLVLVVPFVLQIFIAVGLTGWFSLRNGQRAVSEMATQLRNKTSEQITHHLEDQLLLPHQINQLNLSSIEVGTLDPKNFDQMENLFHKQMQIFDVGYINFATPKGEFIGIERTQNDELLINEMKGTSPHTLFVYSTDVQGDRLEQREVITDLPLTTNEAWYADAAEAQKPVWSEIYAWNDQPDVLSISSSYPVYNDQNQLLGVIGVDLILSDISSFLNRLNFSTSGEVFIIERNGLLVASSSDLPVVMHGDRAKRLYASQSSNLLIQGTAKYLNSHFEDLHQIQSTQHLTFFLNGNQEFLQITPWKDDHGLDWLIVVVLPESDFMQEISANTRTTILLCLLALITAILVGLITSRWISERIQYLAKVSHEIANGNLEQMVQVEGIKELKELGYSFNQMATQLKESFTSLEKRVAQRTVELLEAKDAAEAANRAKSEFLRTMSHELRTPLNIILGVVQVLQQDESLKPEHHEHLRITYRSGTHLLSLINDLLEIAKIGVHQVPSANNRFDLDLSLRPTSNSPYEQEAIDQQLVFYLSQMSSEWLAQLHQAAVKGSDQEILRLIEHIPADFMPLAALLNKWVQEFQFDKVLDLVGHIESF